MSVDRTSEHGTEQGTGAAPLVDRVEEREHAERHGRVEAEAFDEPAGCAPVDEGVADRVDPA